jgi:hypothetical protein
LKREGSGAELVLREDARSLKLEDSGLESTLGEPAAERAEEQKSPNRSRTWRHCITGEIDLR